MKRILTFVKTRLNRTRWLIALTAIIILVSTLVLLAMRIDLGEREEAVLEYFSHQEGMPETFSQLEQLTPTGSILLCWWDYGRAVTEWSHREVIEAYPSKDVWHTVGSSRDPWHNLEAQIFGKWGSSRRIHDLATMFMLPEEEALPIMKGYNASYALVFTPDDLDKFQWIAEIAGYNATDYLTVHGGRYEPTALGSRTTLLRLLLDDTLHPHYFTKLFDNGKGKIYEIEYP